MGIQENVSEILQETREDTPEYRAIQDILKPHRNDPYPSDHIGDFSRFPIEYRWKGKEGNGWIDPIILRNAVARLERSVQCISERDARDLFDEPLNLRGDAGYAGEWTDVVNLGHISNIIGENPAAAEANEIVARRMLPYANEVLMSGQHFYLMDLGIGELGTTKRIIRGIPMELRKRLHVIGVDVMDDARRLSYEALTRPDPAYGYLRPDYVHMVGSMFGQLHRNPEIRGFGGRINAVVSGAAIHHQSDIRPMFEKVYAMMAPGGMLEIWDWLHWLWTAETVRGGRNGNVPQDYIEGLKQMARVWVGLHGYGDEYKDKVERDFNSGIYTVDGFDFHGWMADNLNGREPEEDLRTAYQSAEGHRAPHIYTGALDKLFGNVRHYPMSDFVSEEIPTAVLLHGFSSVKK